MFLRVRLPSSLLALETSYRQDSLLWRPPAFESLQAHLETSISHSYPSLYLYWPMNQKYIRDMLQGGGGKKTFRSPPPPTRPAYDICSIHCQEARQRDRHRIQGMQNQRGRQPSRSRNNLNPLQAALGSLYLLYC